MDFKVNYEYEKILLSKIDIKKYWEKMELLLITLLFLRGRNSDHRESKVPLKESWYH